MLPLINGISKLESRLSSYFVTIKLGPTRFLTLKVEKIYL